MTNVINSLIYYTTSYSYLAVFIFLFSLSFALPISEEVALMVVGFLTKKGYISFPYSLLIAFVGIISGDLFLFYFAKIIGNILRDSKIFLKIFNKKHVDSGVEYIKKDGPKIIFFSRFIVGIRATMMLAAGFLKMSVKTFLIYDVLAALIFIPIMVFLGYFLGIHFDNGVNITQKISTLILAIFIIFSIIYIGKKIWKKKFEKK